MKDRAETVTAVFAYLGSESPITEDWTDAEVSAYVRMTFEDSQTEQKYRERARNILARLGEIKRGQSSTRFGPSNVYTVTLPNHYATNGDGARVLVEGGTHEASASGLGALDWARSQCRKYGLTPNEVWKVAQ